MAANDVVARGADVPLRLSQAGPRDALTDPQPGDIIPDLEEKGYHVGETRQPAEPVLHRSGDVTYESTADDSESKFTGASLRDLKDAHNAREQSDPAYAGTPFVADLLPGETREPTNPDGGAPTVTKAELRQRLTDAGVAEDDQPGSRASLAELQAAVDALPAD